MRVCTCSTEQTARENLEAARARIGAHVHEGDWKKLGRVIGVHVPQKIVVNLFNPWTPNFLLATWERGAFRIEAAVRTEQWRRNAVAYYVYLSTENVVAFSRYYTRLADIRNDVRNLLRLPKEQQ